MCNKMIKLSYIMGFSASQILHHTKQGTVIHLGMRIFDELQWISQSSFPWPASEEAINSFQAQINSQRLWCLVSLGSGRRLWWLLSESHSAQSESNISEIRLQAGLVILARLALQRLMEWGGEGTGRAAIHLPSQHFLFSVRFKNSCWTPPE